MPSLTSAAWAQILRENANDPFYWLVEITHEELPDPIRLTNCVEPINSRDRLFWPARLATSLPSRSNDAPPRARAVLEDVTQEIRRAVRALSPHLSPRISVELVLASDPDTTQRAFRNFRVFSVAFDPVAAEAELRAPSKLLRAAPWAQFTPDLAPAVHRFLAGQT